MSAEERIIADEVHDAIEEESTELSFLRRNVNIRYILCIMGFLGFAILNVLRVSMSVGIVAMVDWETLPRTNKTEQFCNYPAGTKIRSAEESGPYKWKSHLQGHILACYFWGLVVTQYFGGKFAEYVSAKYMLLTGTILCSLGTVLVPQVANAYAYSVMILQILKGLGQGFIIPAFSVLVGKWIPKSERFLSMVIIGSGIPLGGFFGMACAGVICASDSLGWEYVFYIYGGIGLIWCVFWLVLIYDSPLTHPYITQFEMIRILQSQTILPMKDATPYSYIFSSLPVWAYIFVGFASYWALSIYTIVLPTFFSTVLKFDLELNGVWSGVPHLAEMLIFLISNGINQAVKKRDRNYALSYKISIAGGLIGFAICMLAVTFTGCHRVATVVILSVGLALCGFCFASTSQIPVEMTNRYAGFISAVMNTIGAISGIIVPTMMGYLTRRERTMARWSILFYVSMVISVLAAIFFLIFGSCDVQEWNDPAFTRTERRRTPGQEIQIERSPDGQVEIKMAEKAPDIPEEQQTIILKAPA